MIANTLEIALIALKGNDFQIDMNLCRALTTDKERCDVCCLEEFRHSYCAKPFTHDGKEFYSKILLKLRKQKLEKLLSQ